jgi:leucyl/phenylalanyl-tRNA--protein transferase
MPIFKLGKDKTFPPVKFADKNGIIAIGGDLSPERLLNAYSNGIFPWYNEGEPIIWWSPDPRLVLFTDELHISKSMKKIIKKNEFEITFNKSFENVIKNCSLPRTNEKDTWIHQEMINAYIRLHKLGYAISTEVWKKDNLVGGLYGVGMGKCFFGESMFYFESNASKLGIIALTKKLKSLGFPFIDCQVKTEHLISLGAREIPRNKFAKLLELNRSITRIDKLF